MVKGRRKAELVLSEDERLQLQSMVRSRSLPAALGQRAKIVLACAADEANAVVARRMNTTNATVGKWRRRFVERRIAGLHDELRPGKPRSIEDERIAELINKTLHTKPADGATHWSVRSIGAETGISKSSVHRYFQLFGLQPHRQESFKLSTDPVLHRNPMLMEQTLPGAIGRSYDFAFLNASTIGSTRFDFPLSSRAFDFARVSSLSRNVGLSRPPGPTVRWRGFLALHEITLMYRIFRQNE